MTRDFFKIPPAIMTSAGGLSGTARLVYLALAARADFLTGVAFPGTRRLAADAGLPRSTAIDGLRELERAGWVDVIEPGIGRRTSRYRVRSARREGGVAVHPATANGVVAVHPATANGSVAVGGDAVAVGIGLRSGPVGDRNVDTMNVDRERRYAGSNQHAGMTARARRVVSRGDDGDGGAATAAANGAGRPGAAELAAWQEWERRGDILRATYARGAYLAAIGRPLPTVPGFEVPLVDWRLDS